MVEYECLDCGKKYEKPKIYCGLEYEEKFCGECGGKIFYSVDELKRYFGSELKLGRLEQEYKQLESLEYKTKKSKIGQKAKSSQLETVIMNILKDHKK
ncbi:MAG: hypothetical protein PWP03_163 [Candidatus Woesearchaeota archaeon]|nr:hypothetical protein [Candidatus Woesearchaeota archaeon]MDN5327525.1 hypothetical protein [Candidatus Woesearchaeota archaeon]